MKSLLSIFLFLGFIFFSIPSFAETKPYCQTNNTFTINTDYKTKYVGNTDESFTLQDQAIDTAGQALIPEVVRQDSANKASQADITQIGVSKNFVDSLLSSAGGWFADFLRLVGINPCNNLGFLGLGEKLSQYCKFYLAVGNPEQPDKNGLIRGKNTEAYAARSKILGQSSIPENMELIPEEKDCNLGGVGGNTTGDEKINQLSENLGTTTGFFRSNEASLSDFDACIQERMKTENFELGGKLFEQDRRSADIYCSKQVFCDGNYPSGICPFEPPTP